MMTAAFTGGCLFFMNFYKYLLFSIKGTIFAYRLTIKIY